MSMFAAEIMQHSTEPLFTRNYGWRVHANSDLPVAIAAEWLSCLVNR